MKKYIIIITIGILTISSYNLTFSDQSFSDITLSNIEALANEEGFDENGNPVPRTCFQEIEFEFHDKNNDVLYCEPLGDGSYTCREASAGRVDRMANV